MARLPFYDLRFASIDEYVDQAVSGDRTHAGDTSSRREGTQSNDWTGTFDFDEAVSIAREGWRAKREQITTPVNLDADTESFNSTRFDTSGAYVDVDRYLQGDPECMIDFMPQPTKRIVRIGVNMAFSAYVEADVVIKSGSYLLGLIDLLAEHGVGCEVVCISQLRRCWASGKNARAKVFHLEVVVKRPDAPLDIDALAFMVGHPSAFRRLGFSIMEQQDAWFQDQVVSNSYGSPVHEAPDGIDVWSGDMGRPGNVLRSITAFLQGEAPPTFSEY